MNGISSLPPSNRDDEPLLEAVQLGKRYGVNWVLRDVSLQLKPGQVLALLGENGAGKSTLVKILSGAIVQEEGTLRIGGESMPRGRPDACRTAGLAMVYQELSVCDDLSVEDNIMLGCERSRAGWLDRGAQRKIVCETLDRLGHSDLDPSRLVGGLSVGEKQLVEIARALAGDAKVLILDEPTSSLPKGDVQSLFDVVAKLAEQGLAVIYISHFLEEVRQLCDRYLVLRDGLAAGNGALEQVQESEIVRLMVGRSVEELYPQTPHDAGEVVLKANGIGGDPMPTDVDLDVRGGEIYGIAGLVGAGRTELARCLAGLHPRTGSLRFKNKLLAPGNPRRAISAGLAMVSEDRKGEGLAQGLSIGDNMTLSHLSPYATGGFLAEGKRTAAVEELMKRLQVKATGPNQPVSHLSGGNQQKVALARVLHQEGDCLILDEPTRGVDVGTKSEIYRLIGEVAAQGTTVVFISSYFQELLAMCDRITVMSRGKVVETRAAANWSEHELLLAAMSGDRAPSGQSPASQPNQ